MKHRVKMNVVMQKKGLFGTQNVVKEKTVIVSGKEYRKIQQEKRKAEYLAETGCQVSDSGRRNCRGVW